MALNFILSQTSPAAKALVVGTDISRFIATAGGETLTHDWSYFEPSSGAGAVTILVSDDPKVFKFGHIRVQRIYSGQESHEVQGSRLQGNG